MKIWLEILIWEFNWKLQPTDVSTGIVACWYHTDRGQSGHLVWGPAPQKGLLCYIFCKYINLIILGSWNLKGVVFYPALKIRLSVSID